MALGQLQWDFPERVIVEPELLQVLQCADLGTQFHQVVKAQVQSHQVDQREHLRQHRVQVQLIQVQVVSLFGHSQTRLDLVMLRVVLVRGQQLVRLEVRSDLHISFLVINKFN